MKRYEYSEFKITLPDGTCLGPDDEVRVSSEPVDKYAVRLRVTMKLDEYTFLATFLKWYQRPGFWVRTTWRRIRARWRMGKR